MNCKMQEILNQTVSQSSAVENQQDSDDSQHSSTAPGKEASSSPQLSGGGSQVKSPTCGDNLVNSPRNGHTAFPIPVGPPSGGSSGVGLGPNNNEYRHQDAGFQIHRVSSSESIPETSVYPVPIRYRSTIGSFEDHVAAGFANLYSSSELSDVTIACEGKLVKAHKLILAISSPYFRQIFEELHDLPCQHPVVILHGVKLKDWENIMRLIYCGIVHVNSNEIEDFLSVAECLKIDGLAAEDPNSPHEATSPYEYLSRLQGFHSPEEEGSRSGAYDYGRFPSRFRSCSPDDFSISKDQRCERSLTPTRSQGEDEALALTSERSSGRVKVISSTQSSPGLDDRAQNQSHYERTSETHRSREGNYPNDIQHPRPPSCPEALRVYRRSASPNESRVQAVRHPVISRRRNASSDSANEEILENQRSTDNEPCSPSRLVISRSSTMPSYHPGWEREVRRLPSSGEQNVMDEPERQFPPGVISGHHRSSPPPPTMMGHPGHGVTTRYPLSVISRQPSAAVHLHHLLNPAAAMLQRMPALHLLDPRVSHGEGHGEIPVSMPSPPHSHDQDQASTLSMLRAKIASGQHIYSRRYRRDSRSSMHPYDVPRFPTAALGSPSQLRQMDNFGETGSSGHGGGSGFTHTHGSQGSPQSQSVSRSKTKAIRSSQVPQSARYTAAEVDAMVDKVQNFPGNMVPCAICSKFVKRERLRAHIHECHLLQGKKIICPHCGIGLKSKGSFRVHIWRHKRGALPASRLKNDTHSTA